MDSIKFYAVGDQALSVVFGNAISRKINKKQSLMLKSILENEIEAITDLSPTYCSILVQYNSLKISYTELCDYIRNIEENLSSDTEDHRVRIVELPTHYGGEFALDMNHVSAHTQLSVEDIIRIHSERDYLVYMLGFLPGFTYLGGMDTRLATPRLNTPRTAIPKGSVGIAGAQTGVYPSESPGGWQIIGRTPVNMYAIDKESPALVTAGDYIRYVPISMEEYKEIEALGITYKPKEYYCKESEVRGYDPNS